MSHDWSDDDHRCDLCADLRRFRRRDKDCDSIKDVNVVDDRDDCDDCKKRRRRSCPKCIPIGTVTIDCTPVTFKTPGQAKTIVLS